MTGILGLDIYNVITLREHFDPIENSKTPAENFDHATPKTEGTEKSESVTGSKMAPNGTKLSLEEQTN